MRSPSPPRPVVLIGDSIRLGYQPVVARRLDAAARVWGPEENCGSTRAVVANLDEWILRRLEPGAVVHLNAGLHDLRRPPGTSGRPAVPIPEYVANLRTIVGSVTRIAKVTLVLATTTPVDDLRHGSGRRPERHEADVVDYNAALRRVADELGVTVDDLYAVVDLDRERLLGADGVHLSHVGNTRVGDAVATELRRVLERS